MTIFSLSLIWAVVIAGTSLAYAQAPKGEGKLTDSCWGCHRNDKAGRDHGAGIHYAFGVGCADCHGGDPTKAKREEAESKKAGFKARISVFDIPELCDKCHGKSDFVKRSRSRRNPLAEYKEGAHAVALWQKDESRAPQCVTCHGAHRVLRVDDPGSPAHPANVNKTCAKCHADPKYGEAFELDTKIPAEVARGVHGPKGPWRPGLNLPTCASCHGAHRNFQPRVVEAFGVQEVFEVCGSCHTAERAAFGKENPHFRKEVHCAKCHRSHEIVPPTPALFRDPKVCAGCHDPEKRSDDPALAYISEVLEAVAPIEASLERSRRRLMDLREEGFRPQAEAKRVAGAERALLTGFGLVQHRLDLGRIRQELDSVAAQARAAEGAARRAGGRHRFTRAVLWGGAAYVAILVGFIWLRRRGR